MRRNSSRRRIVLRNAIGVKRRRRHCRDFILIGRESGNQEEYSSDDRISADQSPSYRYFEAAATPNWPQD